jgi:hypothetical protein
MKRRKKTTMKMMGHRTNAFKENLGEKRVIPRLARKL